MLRVSERPSWKSGDRLQFDDHDLLVFEKLGPRVFKVYEDACDRNLVLKTPLYVEGGRSQRLLELYQQKPWSQRQLQVPVAGDMNFGLFTFAPGTSLVRILGTMGHFAPERIDLIESYGRHWLTLWHYLTCQNEGEEPDPNKVLIHGDNHLGNVVHSASGWTTIDIDAMRTLDELRYARRAFGSPSVMPPELIKNRKPTHIDHTVDLFGLGMNIERILGGFGDGPVCPPNQLRQVINKGHFGEKTDTARQWLSFVERATAYEANARPRNVSECWHIMGVA